MLKWQYPPSVWRRAHVSSLENMYNGANFKLWSLPWKYILELQTMQFVSEVNVLNTMDHKCFCTTADIDYPAQNSVFRLCCTQVNCGVTETREAKMTKHHWRQQIKSLFEKHADPEKHEQLKETRNGTSSFPCLCLTKKHYKWCCLLMLAERYW